MWTSLKNITHYSFLEAFSKPDKLVDLAKSYGMSSLGVIELNNLTSYVEVNTECRAKGIKPIHGSSLLIQADEDYGYITVIAKNQAGLKNLIKLTSISNDSDLAFPFIQLNSLISNIDENNIVLLGGNNSYFEKTVLIDNQETPDSLKYILYITDKISASRCSIFYEIDTVSNLTNQKIINRLLVKASKQNLVKCIATAESRYHSKDESSMLNILLAAKHKTSIKNLIEKKKDIHLVDSNDYYFKSEQDLIDQSIPSEYIDNTKLVDALCEDYDVTNKPMLPKYEWTDGLSEIDYLRKLCRDGWKKFYTDRWDKEIYGNRVKEELAIIEEADLAGYFLIVRDYVKFAKDNDWLVGASRGSVGGSLVSYLLNITTIDPIKHNLLFSRFFNRGRAAKGEYPDIDMDFPIKKRKFILEHIEKRFGKERVSQMITLNRLQGSSSLKEVISAHEACDFAISNEMTKDLPKEHEIDEMLKDMDIRSILLWTLQNEPKKLEAYCTIDENGELHGDYADVFNLAIKLEGTYKSSGKHAAGVVISKEDLNTVCPMVKDKKDRTNKLAGLEMSHLEKCGHVKFDLLGLLMLDKMMAVKDLLKYGKIVT